MKTILAILGGLVAFGVLVLVLALAAVWLERWIHHDEGPPDVHGGR